MGLTKLTEYTLHCDYYKCEVRFKRNLNSPYAYRFNSELQAKNLAAPLGWYWKGVNIVWCPKHEH